MESTNLNSVGIFMPFDDLSSAVVRSRPPCFAKELRLRCHFATCNWKKQEAGVDDRTTGSPTCSSIFDKF